MGRHFLKFLVTNFSTNNSLTFTQEINEAFASVVVCVEKAFGVEREIMNPYGGAISIGHPFGASGARITARLARTLKPGELGVAGICNGGGGASAILLMGV